MMASDPAQAMTGTSQVYFEKGFIETPFYDRLLNRGNRIDGPAIITQPDCTTVLAPGQMLRSTASAISSFKRRSRGHFMQTDSITIDVIANALKSLIYEMDAAIERTAMSIIIREQHDFGMSLVDHRGWVVAGTTFAGQTLAEYAATNTVERVTLSCSTTPISLMARSRTSAIRCWRLPIFWDRQIIALGIAWGHHMDIGADARRLPIRRPEIFHEGIQIPPVKLYERGKLNQGVLDIVARNSVHRR
ncbi:MAG: hydantoinase B/oxoprolinase family protein [Thermomicrobiales bacterium]